MTGASGQTRAVIRSSRNSNGQGLSQLPASITITVAILPRLPSSPRPTTGASILLRPSETSSIWLPTPASPSDRLLAASTNQGLRFSKACRSASVHPRFQPPPILPKKSGG